MFADAIIRRALQSHYTGFLFLLPFLAMLGVHRLMGFSDALMVPAAPGERPAHFYNFAMVGVLMAGGTAYVVHAATLAERSKRWLVFKLLFLGAFWAAVVNLG